MQQLVQKVIKVWNFNLIQLLALISNHKNKKIYICDYLNNRIQVLNEDFAFCSSWGSTGSGYEFIFPQDVALDSSGSVHIAGRLDHCIQVFTPEGKFLRKFGKWGSGEGELSYPSSVSIDSNDIVYITERDNHRVSIFTGQGKFVRSFGTKGTRPGEFNKPDGISVDTTRVSTWYQHTSCNHQPFWSIYLCCTATCLH